FMALEPVPASPLPPHPGAGEGPDRAALSSAALGRHPGDEVSVPGPTPGPGALDALFAVFVCALAFLLVSTPARNSDLWLHLASGPWLLLQPALLSLLGVVLTLYLLERPSLLEGSRAERARALRWLLVPLFALWANLDAWFLLGPALAGLYALGAVLRRSLGG